MTYDESWDRPHSPTADPNWQESDWLSFYDPKVRVGGICRIGQRPNRGTGQPGLFVFALGAQRFFADDVGGRLDVDISPADRWADGYRVGNLSVDHLGGGRVRFNFDYAEAAGSVEFYEGHYIPRSWSLTKEDIHNLFPDGHLEAGGKVRGKFCIGDETYDVACMGHRDRSWGVRTGYVERVKRIMTCWGTVGPEYSHAVLRFEAKEGEGTVQGFVMRNGVAEEVVAMRHLTTIDVDFISAIEGRVILTLESGEEIKVRCTLAQTHAGRAPGSAFSGVGVLEVGGQRGFCTYSGLVNPSRGKHMSTQDEVTLAVVEKGLSQTREHPVLDW